MDIPNPARESELCHALRRAHEEAQRADAAIGAPAAAHRDMASIYARRARAILRRRTAPILRRAGE